MTQIHSFEDLDAWKQGRLLRRKCYELAKHLPEHERYNLAGQIRSAAVSITANIAEGFGRFHFKENIQFCRVARGSAWELLDHLITCNEEGYLKEDDYRLCRQDIARFLQVLNGYIRSIVKVSNRVVRTAPRGDGFAERMTNNE